MCTIFGRVNTHTKKESANDDGNKTVQWTDDWCFEWYFQNDWARVCVFDVGNSFFFSAYQVIWPECYHLNMGGGMNICLCPPQFYFHFDTRLPIRCAIFPCQQANEQVIPLGIDKNQIKCQHAFRKHTAKPSIWLK